VSCVCCSLEQFAHCICSWLCVIPVANHSNRSAARRSLICDIIVCAVLENAFRLFFSMSLVCVLTVNQVWKTLCRLSAIHEREQLHQCRHLVCLLRGDVPYSWHLHGNRENLGDEHSIYVEHAFSAYDLHVYVSCASDCSFVLVCECCTFCS